jgi:hypothetical protein
MRYGLLQYLDDWRLHRAITLTEKAAKLAPMGRGDTYLWRAARLLTKVGQRQVMLPPGVTAQIKNRIIDMVEVTGIRATVDMASNRRRFMDARLLRHVPALLALGQVRLEDCIGNVATVDAMYCAEGNLFGEVPSVVIERVRRTGQYLQVCAA